MAGCCEHSALNAHKANQKKTLIVVMGINFTMFIVVLVAALIAHSSALLSDSLDNLGDSLTYALSLLVINLSLQAKAKVAFLKGLLILSAALMVTYQITQQLSQPTLPLSLVMLLISTLGLCTNGFCLYLLNQHKNDDINMSSVWECSRNDMASNFAVIITAIAVWYTQSPWPDLIVGSLLILLFLYSATKVLWGATTTLLQPETSTQ